MKGFGVRYWRARSVNAGTPKNVTNLQSQKMLNETAVLFLIVSFLEFLPVPPFLSSFTLLTGERRARLLATACWCSGDRVE